MKLPWTSVALVVGLLMTLAGPLLVSLLLPAQAVWSDADAQGYSQAAANLHEAIHRQGHKPTAGHSHGSASAADPDLAGAQAAFDKQQERLNASASWPERLKLGVRLAGLLFVAVGIFGYVLSRRSG
jgi:hypothetical protein